jgi:hypothetical protein
MSSFDNPRLKKSYIPTIMPDSTLAKKRAAEAEATAAAQQQKESTQNEE